MFKNNKQFLSLLQFILFFLCTKLIQIIAYVYAAASGFACAAGGGNKGCPEGDILLWIVYIAPLIGAWMLYRRSRNLMKTFWLLIILYGLDLLTYIYFIRT